MITLYGFGPGFGLPEISPYVTKTEVQLRMAGLAFRKEQAFPEQSPKGQMPFIKDDGVLIADSTFIRAHIERRHGVDLDAALDPRQRAEAWAIERMVENHFGWTMGYVRFFLAENFAKGPGRSFDHVPEPRRSSMREAMRARVRDAFWAQGVLRHSSDEIQELGARSLEALSLFLGDKPYMMTDRPTGVDAVCFSMLAGLITPFFDSALARRAEEHPSLCAYVDRMMARFYPAFPWCELSQAAA
jgi:glutathione S-transferase